MNTVYLITALLCIIFCQVEEPCEVGCEGLSYCSNFNNRPTELFRSCDINADRAAKENVVSWMQKGSISVPNIKNLFIKNIAECSPITWQTIACTLQIRPCQRSTQVTRICKWVTLFKNSPSLPLWEYLLQHSSHWYISSGIKVLNNLFLMFLNLFCIAPFPFKLFYISLLTSQLKKF